MSKRTVPRTAGTEPELRRIRGASAPLGEVSYSTAQRSLLRQPLQQIAVRRADRGPCREQDLNVLE
jgi:hypothetical protein